MQKSLLSTLSFLLLFICLGTKAQMADFSKMSPMIADQMHTAQRAKSLKGAVAKQSGAIIAMVKLQGKDKEGALLSHGCQILDNIGDIYIAILPDESIAGLSLDERVVRIEANPPQSILVDSIAGSTNLLPAYAGTDLPQAYTGKGVIVGVVDLGFDFTHPMFLDQEGKSRIKSAWDIFTGKHEGHKGIGSLYTTHEQLMAAGGTCDSMLYHATHVTGIAAGSPVNEGKYRGVAYDADIVVSNVILSDVPNELSANAIADLNAYLSGGNYDSYWKYFESDDITLTDAVAILALKYVMDYASEHSQPCVVNCSFGEQMYLYRDYTILNELFTQLTGPGRIIVCSAGNDSDTDIYRLKPQGETLSESIFFRNSMTPSISMRSAKSFTIKTHPDVDGFDTLTISSTDIPLVSDSEPYSKTIFRGDPSNIFGITAASKYIMQEGDTAYRLTFTLPSMSANTYRSASMTFTVEGEGDVEVMGSFGAAGFTRFSLYPVSSPYTVNSPGMLDAAISVGAMSYRDSLVNIYGDKKAVSYNKGDAGHIVSWSGTGPTLEGKAKPDIAAAGYNVVSAYNSWLPQSMYTGTYATKIIDTVESDGKTYYMYADSGTSMAAPVVTGTIALWLQADPTLTPDRIKDILARTAMHPDDSDTYPNMRYGYGAIDAYKGLCDILGVTDHIAHFSDHQPRSLQISLSGRTLTLAGTADATVSIYSISGQLIKKTTLTNGVVSLSELPEGVYAVQIDSSAPSATGSTLIRLQ